MSIAFVYILIIIILPCIFTVGITYTFINKIFGTIMCLFSAGFWFMLIIALWTAGEPTIKNIKTYSITEVPTPDSGKVQIAFVEGELINITKLKNVLFGNPEGRRLEVTTYNQCQNWICREVDTILENEPTYKIIMAEGNNVQTH